jgi:hypothetical protein
MANFKIEVVKCKNCASGLMVEMNDSVTYCSSCGNGYEIIDGDLYPIEINFAAAALPSEGELIYKPFWYLKANVTILVRESDKGYYSDGGGKKAYGDIIFYIPAFSCPVESMRQLAIAYTQRNPVASPQKYNVKVTGFNYGKEDARKLAEFVLISLEAEKKDTMKQFEYKIDFNSFEILGIPFYKLSNGKLKDAVLGITI